MLLIECLHEHEQQVNYTLRNNFVGARRTKGEANYLYKVIVVRSRKDPIVTRPDVPHLLHLPQNRSMSSHEAAEVHSRSTRKTRRSYDSISKSQPGANIVGLFQINRICQS